MGLALVAVCALGFAAGRFLGRDGSATPEFVTYPVVAPTGTAVSGSPATAQGMPRRVPATIHEILKLPGDFAQTTALYVLAASQDQDGIERLLAEARSIKRVSESRAAASILYGRFAELDPEAAVEHMVRGDSGFDPNWLYGVFHSWARTDLEAALKRASKLDDRSRQMAGMAIPSGAHGFRLALAEGRGACVAKRAGDGRPRGARTGSSTTWHATGGNRTRRRRFGRSSRFGTAIRGINCSRSQYMPGPKRMRGRRPTGRSNDRRPSSDRNFFRVSWVSS